MNMKSKSKKLLKSTGRFVIETKIILLNWRQTIINRADAKCKPYSNCNYTLQLIGKT